MYMYLQQCTTNTNVKAEIPMFSRTEKKFPVFAQPQ